MKIAIITCTKKKIKHDHVPARDLYSASYLFRLSYAVIKKYHPDLPVFILSAKYGLIPEDKKISYYDMTFKDIPKVDRPLIKANDYVFIGGSIYRDVLSSKPTKEYGAGLPIGKKLAYLKGLL